MKRMTGGKKKLIVSYESLSEELKELFKEEYSQGYREYMQKIVKPNGEPIFVVPLETEEVSYMVKFEVAIDSKVSDEDIDKDLENLTKDDEEISVDLDTVEDGKDSSFKEFSLNHGDYGEDSDLGKEEEEDAEGDEEEDDEEE